uniref:Transposase n=2 Tax=Mesocestoides corti TaxID=53468 RepID=A0A5K3FC31_MESCO
MNHAELSLAQGATIGKTYPQSNTSMPSRPANPAPCDAQIRSQGSVPSSDGSSESQVPPMKSPLQNPTTETSFKRNNQHKSRRRRDNIQILEARSRLKQRGPQSRFSSVSKDGRYSCTPPRCLSPLTSTADEGGSQKRTRRIRVRRNPHSMKEKPLSVWPPTSNSAKPPPFSPTSHADLMLHAS